MKTLRNLFNPFRVQGNRFDRYYGGILRQGSGYPTADEARKDMRRHDQVVNGQVGWFR